MSASKIAAKSLAASPLKRKTATVKATAKTASIRRKSADTAASTRAMLDEIHERGVALTARLNALLDRLG